MQRGPVQLSALDIVPDRPFTCVAQGEQDRQHMQRMVEMLRDVLATETPSLHSKRLDIFYLKEPDGRPHRVVISDWRGLVGGSDLIVVGFFGQRRPDADATHTHRADAVLLQEFTHHPDLLSYSSMELPGGDWGNLVLFHTLQGPEHWGTSKFHAEVAQEISPRYYLSIRLHNGELPGGPLSGQPVRLIRTKYYDFTEQPMWRAVRTLR